MLRWEKYVPAAAAAGLALATRTAGIVMIPVILWEMRCLRPAMSLYGLGALMLPDVTFGITDSMNRFIVTCFPAWACCAGNTRGSPAF